MKRKLSAIPLIQLSLCGLLLLLAGCPGAGNPSGVSPIASVLVQNVQGDGTVCTIPSQEEELRSRVIDLVNRERTSRSLNPLTADTQLNEMSEDYCCEMIEGGFFAHDNPYTGEGPGQRAINAGYIYLAVGENLAAGQTSPEQVVADWMASTEGHRENILSSQWREVGVGIRTGGQYGVYWVLEFGNPP